MTMPEEVNRIVADRFADHLLIHSDEAIENLRAEGIADERMHFVGNTMIDSLVAVEDRFRGLAACSGLGVEPGGYLLVTLHRPALVDGPLLHDAMRHLATVAETLPVVFPVHPRTRKMLGGSADAAGVRLVDPVGYLDFLSLQSGAGAIVTDSGTVQEEASALGVRCYTLRSSTERTITLTHGTNALLGDDPRDLVDVRPSAGAPTPCAIPLWDGHAADRAAAAVIEAFPEVAQLPEAAIA